MRVNKHIQAIIFDLGSTLVCFEGDWSNVIPKAIREMYLSLWEAGFALEEEEFINRFQQALLAYNRERETEFIEYTTNYLLKNTLIDFGLQTPSDEILERSLQRFYSVTQEHWKLEPDALPTLEKLKDQGYRLGMISNAEDDADVQTLVDNSGIRPYFDIIVTSAAEGIRKPNPEIFRKLLRFWELKSNQVVMVGDSLGADILGAINAGIYSIWLTRRADTAANRAHLDTIQPDATVDSLGEIPDLIAKKSYL